MTRGLSKNLALLVSVMCLGFAASQSGNQAQPPTAAPSALARQLKAGETTYFLSCAMCHGDRLEGQSAPELSGQAFGHSYSGVAYAQLAAYIQERMPDDQPGYLTEQEVLDVTAYLLSENGVILPEDGLTLENGQNLIEFRKAKP